MSDCSDAESSDDDLLASPVFKKRDRRTERAEKNKLDFFDTCLKGSDARTDVHRRIAFVENEFKKERGGDEGGAAGGGGEGAVVFASDGARKGGNKTGDNDGGKENNAKNNAAARAAEPPALKSEDNAEEAYWKRIDTFAEQVAQKTPGGDIDSARRKLSDAVSGLDYASDLTDDEGGKWRDGVSGMTREQMRSEAEAKSQGLSSHLGLRDMFRPVADAAAGAANKKKVVQRANAMRFFDSRKEAMNGLRGIVSSLQRAHRSPKTPAQKALRKHFVDLLAKIIKKPQDCVWDYLGFFLRKNPVMSGKYAVALPESFCKWMWKLACSPFRVGQQCSTDCFRLVRKFITKELDVRKDAPSFGADMTFLKNLRMGDLVSCLENDFGLWLEHGPVPPAADGNDGDANHGVAMKSSEKNSRTVDMCVLKNILSLWVALIRRNLVQIRGDDEDDSVKALVAFTRVGLDPHLYSAGDCADTCGEPLHALVQQISLALIRSATSQLDGSHVEQWMKRAACRVVDACSELSAGAEGAADSDDVDGYLPLAMAVKRMCFCEFDNDFSLDIALMKMNLAEQALHNCLEEITDWKDKVKERADFLCKDWDKKNTSGSPARDRLQHAMHALVTAEVGFQWIEEDSEPFMRNHPHLLAAVSIAGECALVGTCIFWSSQSDSQSEEQVYSAEERDAVHESISNIEDLCDGIKKECRAVIAYPHLRRTKEYLTRLSKRLGGTKGKSSQDKRRKRREQGSLDSYFSRPSMSDPFRDTQDS